MIPSEVNFKEERWEISIFGEATFYIPRTETTDLISNLKLLIKDIERIAYEEKETYHERRV